MKNQKLRILVECAIFIALASVLSMIKIYEAPLGGAVTLFSMLPIILISFRYGIKWGLGSAMVYSALQLFLGLGNIMYIPSIKGIVLCILLDYLIAFTLLGLAGIFNNFKMITNQYVKVICGTLLVCLTRFISHVIVGGVVWYEITKAGDWNELVHKTSTWIYSTIYNLQYMIPETIITLIGAIAVVKLLSHLTEKKVTT